MSWPFEVFFPLAVDSWIFFFFLGCIYLQEKIIEEEEEGESET